MANGVSLLLLKLLLLKLLLLLLLVLLLVVVVASVSVSAAAAVARPLRAILLAIAASTSASSARVDRHASGGSDSGLPVGGWSGQARHVPGGMESPPPVLVAALASALASASASASAATVAVAAAEAPCFHPSSPPPYFPAGQGKHALAPALVPPSAWPVWNPTRHL